MGSNIIDLAKLGHERAAELKASCGAVDVRSLAQLISDLATQLEVQFVRSTNMAVQLANAESKCRELAAEISRRDEIFVPVYPDENTMNRMTDVFHDTAKIHCDEDSIFVDNSELVITAIINHYIKSDDAFLAEVRAQGVERYAAQLKSEAELADETGWDGAAKFLISESEKVLAFAAQLRQGAKS
ncbi:hypothetical protein FYE58_08595 [Salmonella enterica]|nr:hypothetical protein [Salmonella enterica]ECO5358360.1 hypothetical protein [Salmonella enterica]